ncbi:MAG: MotA/TolQ/ExbB proton channel family protein [Planctomycetota bacterium]|nr:MotA/TolQ/ExbB proton channel family protein [Planctomycetota bacterium]
MTQLRLSRLAMWSIALCCIVTMYGVVGLKAQDAPEADPAAAPAAEPVDDPADGTAPAEKQTLGLLIVQSNMLSLVFYAVLLIFSMVAATVIIERLVNLRRSRVLPNRFADGLRVLLDRSEDTALSFRQLCDAAPSPVAKILKAGVFRAGRTLPEVEKAMEDAAMREMAAMRARNRPLSVVGSIAPLVGLLGTVVGMIFAFGEASEQGLGKAESLAHGIYLALMTTAGGLTIAIPALLCTAWFNARAERFMRDIDECLLDTVPSFARMERAPTYAASVKPSESTEDAEELVGAARSK